MMYVLSILLFLLQNIVILVCYYSNQTLYFIFQWATYSHKKIICKYFQQLIELNFKFYKTVNNIKMINVAYSRQYILTCTKMRCMYSGNLL